MEIMALIDNKWKHRGHYMLIYGYTSKYVCPYYDDCVRVRARR